MAPIIRDIESALSSYPNLPSSFDGLKKIQEWVGFFSTKSASYDLTEAEIRQLKYDLEHTMTAFNEKVLGSRWFNCSSSK